MRIYVANDNFVPCPLNVNPYETISSLKPRICEIFGLTGEQMNQRLLVLDGRGLNPTLTLENGYDLLQFDGTTLQEFGIKEEETLRLGWKGPFVIKLVAETFAHEITVGDCYETVHDLKMRIEGVTGEPVTEENLPEFFSSPAAANHTLLSFGLYKLVNHCYVQHTIFRNRKNLIFPEKCQGLDVSQGHASVDPGHYSWSSSSGQVKAYQNDTGPIENGTPSTLWPYYDPHNNISREGKDGINTASQASTSVSLSASNETQGYSNYPPHTSSANSYVFDNAGQMNYYNAYSHQAYDSSSQQMGANQNSGAPCQPLCSFQSSYVTPASYPDTYNVNGDHQTGYIPISQTNYWNDPNYGGYTQHYPSYPSSDTNSAQTTSTAAASSQYFGQSYNQWPYHSFAPNVSCAPRTENTSVNTTYSAASSAQIGSVSYPYPSNQPPPPGTTSWRKDSDSSALPSLQEVKHVSSSSQKDGWEAGASGFPNYSVHQNPSYFQTPYESVPPHRNSEDLHKTIYPQGPTSQLPLNNQASENFPLPLQTETTYDTRRPSKMQIPTNPRIASNFSGMQKVNRESSTTINKPAYIGVNVSNHTEPEVKEKHGTFPAALSAYVERTLARCKDDAQRTSTQNIMKEMITKASADGTLFTRNWDMEPLFPLPNTSNLADQNNAARPVAISPLPERNSTRRSKSRWGPIPEETSIEKLASASDGFAKDVSRDNLKATVRDVNSRRFEKDSGLNGLKFVLSQHMSVNKIAQRPVKKPRFSDYSIVIENGEASSDSDKEQSLTKYYASATALSDSPEERKRREHRSKRFDKGKENHAEAKHTKETAGSGNIYIRRASTMLLAKKFENGSSRAVEDIDWDALTVKGTSQEIEKRYLRLTSAPDPTTVRPEEILGKALHMVQTSSKNYLYKCDQLKSIRQDLTVQRIQNELTVKVYETHARFALEAGDVPEFNQCQSQLKRLYSEGIKGSHMEFSAYNLLCVILHSNNKRDLLSSMARLSEEAKEDEAVKHALAVRSAVSRGNYILFFKLYKAAPNMNTCLMDLYVEKIRYEAVKCMSKSYRPMVPISYVARVLGFSRTVRNEDGQDKEIDGLEECGEWLRAHGATLIVDNSGELQIDTKVSSSNLYMPDPEDAVAHGDATLAVNDFLTRAL